MNLLSHRRCARYAITVVSKILVVDDSAIVRRVASAALTKAGHRVAVAPNVESALIEALAETPALVVLDDTIPGSDPQAFLERLHAEERSVPVIMLVSQGVSQGVLQGVRQSSFDSNAGRALGVVDALSKPFAADALVAVAEHWLKKLQRGQEPTTVPPTLPPLAAVASIVPAAVVAPASMTQALADALAMHGVREADDIAARVARELQSNAELHDAWGDPQRRPALSGDLAAVPLPEVLQLLKFQSQTGLVDVRLDAQPPVRFSIGLVDGAVVSLRATNARADLLLGHYFVAAGYVSESDLATHLAVRSPIPLGVRLRQMNLVTDEQLRRCLIEQSQDLMYELLRARSGSFALRRGADVIPKPYLEPGVGIDALLFEGLRRVDEWRVVEREVPSLSVSFVRTTDDDAGLAPEESAVFVLLPRGTHASTDGVSVVKLTTTMRMRAFDISKVLYRLVVLKRVVRVGALPTSIDGDVSESLLSVMSGVDAES